jgi:hypothetical protein
LNDLQAATMWFMSNAMAKPDNAGAGATDYMHLFGLVALGFMWAKSAKAAQGGLAPAIRDGLPEQQAGDGAVLHGTHDAGDGAAQGPHRNRRRQHHGADAAAF